MKKHIILITIVGLFLFVLPLVAGAETMALNSTDGIPVENAEQMNYSTWNLLDNQTVTVDSFTKQKLDNGHIRFSLLCTAPAGYHIGVCSGQPSDPVADRALFITSDAFTTSNQSTVLFDIPVLFSGDFFISFYNDDNNGQGMFYIYFSLPVPAKAEIGGTCGNDLEWTLDAEGLLTITGTGAMDNYQIILLSSTENGDVYTTDTPWKSYEDYIKRIEISKGVSSIGNSAFYYCSKLSGVTIPESVTRIGQDAFMGCGNLTDITIPDGVTSIEDGTFSGCRSLTGVIIPEGVVSIGYSSFQGCENLSSVTIPDSLTSIGWYAFAWCSNLSGIHIPDSVTSIGIAAFHSTNLSDITIPDGITGIGDATFAWCSNLSGITIPSSVTTIGYNAFCGCSSLTDITLLDNVTSIVDNAFTDCSNLTIHGYQNTTAQQFAADHNIPFKVIAQDQKIEAFVTRCYQVILGRNPDPDGFANWCAALSAGKATASEIIDGFVNSTEFQNKKLSNEESVEVLYQAMLGRGSDPAGLADWKKKLDDGNPFALIINGFCGSTEFTNLCNEYGIKPGSVAINEKDIALNKIKAFVKRCYNVILERDAEPEGLENWTNALSSGKSTASEIIDGFVNSQEFQNKQLTNEQSVEVLYQAMLGRGSDPAGLADWTKKLDEGNPFAVIINGFCGSTEFSNICKDYGIKPGSVKIKDVGLRGASAAAEEPMTEASAVQEAPVQAADAESESPENTEVKALVYSNETKVREFVQYCYTTVLGRSASEGELADYAERIMSGKAAPKKATEEIIFSAEFQNRNLSNEEVVRILYRLYLRQDIDEDTLNQLVLQLDGGKPLKSLVNKLANSREFKAFVTMMR